MPARGRLRRSRSATSACRPSPDASSAFHDGEIIYISLGEGATSEGEFWEALNAASQRSCRSSFLVEDNGYAISVPVEEQTPGGDISRLVQASRTCYIE